MFRIVILVYFTILLLHVKIIFAVSENESFIHGESTENLAIYNYADSTVANLEEFSLSTIYYNSSDASKRRKNKILEHDDNEYLDEVRDGNLDIRDILTAKSRCSQCRLEGSHPANQQILLRDTCEHYRRKLKKKNVQEYFLFKKSLDKFIKHRKYGSIVKWTKVADHISFQKFQGIVPLNGTCKVGDDLKTMCINFKIQSCILQKKRVNCTASLTNYACHPERKRCEKDVHIAPPELANKLSSHTDSKTKCITDKGMEVFESILSTNYEDKMDGKVLYNEKCEPFRDQPPEKRCKLMSSKALQIPTKLKRCHKLTHLKCDPVLRKCVCGMSDYPEHHFQFGNNSNICFIRPTFDVIEGYTCPFGTEASEMPHYNNRKICKCEISPDHFNSKCRDWWNCKASFVKNPSGQLLIVSLIIFKMVY